MIFCSWPILFLLGMHADTGSRKISFSKNCEKAIVAHHWPGNVRELENAVERAVILADAGKKIEADLLGIADIPHTSCNKTRKSHLIMKNLMMKRWKMLSVSTSKRFWNPVRVTEPMQLKSLV